MSRHPAPRRQSGLTLIGFSLVAGLLALIGVECLRAYPLYLEYYEIQKGLKRVAESGNDAVEVRKAFDKFASVNNITSITGQDVKVSRTDAGVVASAAYYAWAHLVGNIYVVISFKASSRPMKDEE